MRRRQSRRRAAVGARPDADPAAGMQSGVVLVIVLVLLGVMSVMAMFALRLAVASDAIGASHAAHAQALQAAELALRYCESEIGRPGSPVVIQPAADPALAAAPLWQDARQWAGDAPPAAAVPDTLVREGLAQSLPPDLPAPRCLVEALDLRRTRGADDRLQAWRVTARGTSVDWQPDGRGAEVWLQSEVRR